MIKYCPKCHKEAYRLVEGEETVKVMQGRGTVLNLNRSSSINMSLTCPSGHPVELKIKPKGEHEPLKVTHEQRTL